MKIKTSNKSKKTLIFSLVAILMTIVLLIPLFTTKPKSKDTTAEIQEQTITFSIDNEEFSADREMTWEQWVESEYNTEEYSIDENDYVCNENGKLTRNSNLIKKNYFVIENAEYIFVINSYILNIEYDNYYGENTNLSIIYEQDMTWADWLNSNYKNINLVSVNNGGLYEITQNSLIPNMSIIHYLIDIDDENIVIPTDFILSNHEYSLLLEINFEIDNTTYYAIHGMTFEQWVDSDFNIDNYYVDIDNYITDGTNFVSYSSSYVVDTDEIVFNREYDLTNPIPEPELIGFTIQYSGSDVQQLFDTESDMTWTDWVNSEYNTINLVISNNQIFTNNNNYRLEMLNNNSIPQPVYATDTIADTNYYLRPFGGGGN